MATATADDYYGQLTKAVDANGNPTTYSAFDATGNPETITDALAHATKFVYDERGQVTKVTDADDKVTTQTYDTFGRPLVRTVPKEQDKGDLITTPAPEYDANDNVTTSTAPNGAVSTAVYDAADQITSATAPKDTTTSDERRTTYTYDKAGNLTTTTEPKGTLTTSDPADHVTTNHYDEIYQLTSVVNADGDTISYGYDDVGNTTKVITPRAVAADTTTAFTARTEYDALNRPVKQYQPYDPADTRHNDPNVYTETVYDKVGRVAKTSLPPSEGQTVRNTTVLDYFDNGWVRSSPDPWDIATAYDYNDLGQQTARTLTSAGGSSNRTMTWSYYPDGKLRSKADDGVPVGRSVVLVDNSDSQNTTSTGTWTQGDSPGQQGYDHRAHAAGTGTDAFTWTLNIPEDGTYTAYVKYPKVTGAATAAAYTLTHGTTTERPSPRTRRPPPAPGSPSATTPSSRARTPN
ncbi:MULTISPECIES: hypothetical protein [unclassified Streptomyces]|uniref:golvesin C-terminal-like domain-containing protein n=1 Tax=unclassified Streptomyces TaxID=2593676 RepID=UPI0034501DE8